MDTFGIFDNYLTVVKIMVRLTVKITEGFDYQFGNQRLIILFLSHGIGYG